jgi:hypothetical protein
MGEVFEEYPQMCQWLRPHEFLVHVGLPDKLLHVPVSTDADETLAPHREEVGSALRRYFSARARANAQQDRKAGQSRTCHG